ncbi:MAG: hypothetical protein JWR60_1774 [Polaromonas sp.]|nr:hypothetical protein [Polaromonas sp.]
MNPLFIFLRPWPTLALAACLLGAPAAQAQTITSSGALSFGAFVAGAGGSVVVDSSGSRSKTGSVIPVLQGGSATAALFTVTGTVTSITLPSDQGGSGDVTLTRDGGVETMVVNAFTKSLSGQLLQVGAKLTVGAAQPPGSYTGTFNVTANFE